MPDAFEPGIIRQFLRRVEATLAEFDMLPAKGPVLVAVSGGPDSVALLDALLALRPAGRPLPGVAHLNHALREEESERDAAFVSDLARRLGVPLHVERQDVRRYRETRRCSPEEAAREVRYGFLERTARAEGYVRVALGHHLDDNAEWVLMNLLRGSGPQGLAGIPPVRGLFIRPLIRLPRDRIRAYLEARGLGFVLDRSNTNPRFLRNRVRHHLLPSLAAAYNPRISEALGRMALIRHSEEAWLESLLDPLWEKALVTAADHRVVLDVRALRSLHPAAGRRILRRALERVRGSLRRIGLVHVEAILRLAGKDAAGMLSLPDRVGVAKQNDRIIISRRPAQEESPSGRPAPFEYVIDQPGSFFIAELGARMTFSEVGPKPVSMLKQAGQRVAFFDMNAVSFPMVLRSIRPGDRFRPLGIGGTQKVKKYFIDHKVSREARRQSPVLLSEGRIIWLVGHRLDESAKVRDPRRNMLRAELSLASKNKDVYHGAKESTR